MNSNLTFSIKSADLTIIPEEIPHDDFPVIIFKYISAGPICQNNLDPLPKTIL